MSLHGVATSTETQPIPGIAQDDVPSINSPHGKYLLCGILMFVHAQRVRSAYLYFLQNGEYDTFANLHSGMVVTSAHVGPNFFGWHRVYCAL